MLSRKMLLLALALAVGCNGDSTGNSRSFLDGTADNPEIGLVIDDLGRALTMFQVGNPSERRQIPLGTSDLITPVALSLRGTRAVVPLGQAASVALVNLATGKIERFFTFPSGNTTGSAWVDDNTFVVANLTENYVGKATLNQASTAIATTVDVATAPTAIVAAGGRVFVVSGNYTISGWNLVPLGNGIVTAIDPTTMTVIDAVETGGINASAAAVGPDGKLYVLNTGDYLSGTSVTVIDPVAMTAEATWTGFPVGAGSIRIKDDGLAYVSSASAGTVVWNITTHEFVRDAAHPVCAGDPCRGAFDADRASDGLLYQVFFGDTYNQLPPYIFVYAPNTYELVDSIPAGVGPTSIDIARFRPLE